MSVDFDRQEWRRLEDRRHEWELRDQVLAFTQRWPLLVLAFLLGSLLGWSYALVSPGAYRAEAGLFVGFNADLVLRWHLAAV
jgi:uncharacterized protein involved in exopolysaccharide biosynthesis